MIPDLLTPCEDGDCAEIGDWRCRGCGGTFCDAHKECHDCVALES